MTMLKGSKNDQFINYRMRVTIQDGRQLVGKFMSYDRHMNLALGDCEEFRKLPPAKGSKSEEREDRRTLGFVLLRGEEVVTMTVEGPPPPEESRAKTVAASAMDGPGAGRSAGRGVPIAPVVQAQPGLAGPVRGVGGPALGMMQPQISQPPMSYPGAPVFRPPPPQQMPGLQLPVGPPQMPLRGPPAQFPHQGQYPPRPNSAPLGPFPVTPPQYAQRPGMSGQPPVMMQGPPPPPRPGMPAPPPSVYGPPRPGMPPPADVQQAPQS